jgi:hypothetical protein
MFPVRNETVKKNYISDQPNTAHVRCEVLTVVLLEIQVFWDIFTLLALRSFEVLGLLTNALRQIPSDSNLKTLLIL